MKKNLSVLIFFLLISLSANSQQKESLKITWPEEYKWKIGSNQENAQIHLMELIPGKETLEKWTLMGNMMAIKNGQDIPVDAAMKMMFEQAQKNSDNAKLTLIEKSQDKGKNAWILFTIEAASFHDSKDPESQLYYITAGKTALYTNFIAVREAKLKDKFIEKWSKVFKESEVVLQ